MNELLFEPLGWLPNAQGVAQLRSALPAARARWRARQIESYDIQVKGFVPLSCQLEAVLSVRHHALMAVQARPAPWNTASPWEPLGSQRWDLPFFSYRQLTIPSVLAQVARDLQTADFSAEALAVNFDPDYGFVTHYTHRLGYRHGFWNPALSEGWVEYTFSRFCVWDVDSSADG